MLAGIVVVGWRAQQAQSAQSAVATPALLARAMTGPALVLSVREPVSEAQVQAAVDEARTGEALARVFTYSATAQVGTDKSASSYSWTPGDSLRRAYRSRTCCARRSLLPALR